MHIYIYPHIYAYAYKCTRKHMRMHSIVHTLKHWYQDHNLGTNMHTHTHTHVYKRIDVQINTHMHIYTYIHVRTHTHIHIYTHTHTKYTYERTQARLERRRGSERARSRCTERKLCTSLSFDAIKPHFAPPMQGLHCTHFLEHQYPSTLHPLFPTYPRTVRGLRASAVLVFYTDQMNRVHSSEEAPRSFTMTPCAVVARLEGKQRCSRAAVSKHAGIQAQEWSRWLYTKKREVNEKTTKPCNSPHTITKVRRQDIIPLICTGAGPIHPVHSRAMSLATEAMPETRLHFCHFPAFTQWAPWHLGLRPRLRQTCQKGPCNCWWARGWWNI